MEQQPEQVQDAKRALDDGETLIDGVFALVVDIEGTTTPISFVKEFLFPYASDNVEKFLTDNYKEDETQGDISALRDLAAKEKEDNADIVGVPEATDDNSSEVIKAVCENVKTLMAKDSKSPALKQLQGHIWRDGYKSGKIKSIVFPDVIPMLRQLKDELPGGIYVYSSGSVEAQKLLFGHVNDEGDCTDVFSGYFDTEVGSKTDPNSYMKIMDHINSATEAEDDDPTDILFLTDMPAEAEAAGKAGCRVALVTRKGNEALSAEDKKNFIVIDSFCELFGEDDEPEYYTKQCKTDGNGEVSSDEGDIYPEDEDEEDLGDDGENLGEDGEDECPEDEGDDLSE